MYYEVMVVLTIREVPADVRDMLAQVARERGQSLQAFVLGVLKRQAAFGRNRQLLADMERRLARGGGAGPDAPSAADVLARERLEHERSRDVRTPQDIGGAA